MATTMNGVLRFPDRSEAGALDVHPITLTGSLVQLQPLHSIHIGDLEEAALDRSIFDLFMDNWIILRFGISTYVYKLLEELAAGSALPFAVYHLSWRRVIGVTRCYNIDRRNRTLEIATWYGKLFHRTGVNTEAKYLLLRHAFDSLHCNRVEFAIDVRNAISIRAIERLGATKEGERRQHLILADGHSRTSAVYSIIRSEWELTVRAQLEELLQREYPGPATLPQCDHNRAGSPMINCRATECADNLTTHVAQKAENFQHLSDFPGTDPQQREDTPNLQTLRAFQQGLAETRTAEERKLEGLHPRLQLQEENRVPATEPDTCAKLRLGIITTGGTFEKTYLPGPGRLDFTRTHVDAMLQLAGVAPNTVRVRQPFLKDSLQMTDRDRDLLIAECQVAEEERLVIVHGTDTMVLSAERLARAAFTRVIILVGAFVPYCCKDSDALFNLGFALAAARLIPRHGVYIAMHATLFPWDRVIKDIQHARFEWTA